jgi:hypothetical protein
MAKDKNSEALELAQKLVKVLKGASEKESVKMPEPDDVADLSKEAVAQIAEGFGISTEDGPKALRSLIKTASQIVAGETDDLEDDEVTALCEATGVTPKKKQAQTITALSEYFDAAKDTEDGDSSSSEEEEDEEAEAKPSKKSSKKDEDEEEEENEDEEAEAKPSKKSSKKDKDEEEDEDGEEEVKPKKAKGEVVDEKEQAKRVKAFNKVADEEVEDYDALKELLTDDDGKVAKWGEAYVKDEEGYCCGLPLQEAKLNKEDVGKCQITGKFFKQDDDTAELVEVEAD